MIGDKELLYSEKNRAKLRIPAEAIRQPRIRPDALKTKGDGTPSSEVTCCLQVVAACWVGLEGHMLSKRMGHLGHYVLEHDLMSSLGCVWSSGESSGSSSLPSFPGSVLQGRLLARALTSHYLHGDGTMVSQTHDLTPWLCQRVHWRGSFGGLGSLVGM